MRQAKWRPLSSAARGARQRQPRPASSCNRNTDPWPQADRSAGGPGPGVTVTATASGTAHRRHDTRPHDSGEWTVGTKCAVLSKFAKMDARGPRAPPLNGILRRQRSYARMSRLYLELRHSLTAPLRRMKSQRHGTAQQRWAEICRVQVVSSLEPANQPRLIVDSTNAPTSSHGGRTEL